MRANINFEIGMDRVQVVMNALVLEEATGLQTAVDHLCETTPEDLYDGLSAALENIHAVTRQLEQYRAMIASFQKAKFETMLPQPAASPPQAEASSMADVHAAMESMKNFDSFLSQVSDGPEVDDLPGGLEHDDPQEG